MLAGLTLALLLPTLALAGDPPGGTQADSGKAAPAKAVAAPAKNTGPAHVQVQHILIGFSGSVPGKSITRTPAQAKKLANEILKRARKGESFDELVKTYTDDQAPGIYGMSNVGATPAEGEYPRTGMVQSFGDVGFSLKVGKVGMASYDPAKSKFGYHIIKRLK
jgi:parvulin-like peptidyl-prolyl isomerase